MTDKEIEVTNIGKADRVIFDSNKQPVTVKPGQKVKATVSDKMAERLGQASEQGDTLKVS